MAHNLPALKQQRDRLQKRGFSLIEAAFVLAVVGAVIGTIWWAAASLTERNRANETIRVVAVAVDKIRNLLSQVQIYTYPEHTNFNALAQAIGALPPGDYTGSVISSGVVYISEGDHGGIRVTLFLLSSTLCTKVLHNFSGMASVYRISRVKFENSGTNYFDFPISDELISQECSTSYGRFFIEFSK